MKKKSIFDRMYITYIEVQDRSMAAAERDRLRRQEKLCQQETEAKQAESRETTSPAEPEEDEWLWEE